MTKKERRIMTLAVALAFVFGVMPVSYAMHIMEGICPLATVWHGGLSACRFWQQDFLYPPHTGAKQKEHYRACHGRGVYFCDLIPEDSVCYGKLFPYDRNRSGSDPVRTGLREHLSELSY